MGQDQQDVRAERMVVRGLVQGVGFRWSTVQQASRLGLSGWVTNRPDGTVELHAEGSPEALDALARWANEGPRHSSVEQVERTSAKVHGHHGFDVR